MRSICLYFQVHQPYRLKTYRFFHIGDDHQYFDEYQNRSIIRRVSEKCYLPANKMMLSLIREYGSAFRVSYSISGPALEQLQQYAPEVIQSFRELANTGCVEFLSEPYAHSLASLGSPEEFVRQVKLHSETIEKIFGQRPVTIRNAELIYSDKIGSMVADMGYTTMMTEGAKHILGWKSPNYMYCSSVNPKLKLLLRNFRLSDDISFRFSNHSWAEWPLTTEKFVGWLNQIAPMEEVVNVALDYETIGERQWKETGIFEFFKSLPKAVFSRSNFTFSTPKELADKLQPVASIHVPYPISWADEERDLTSWLGNELQDEAFAKLYSVQEKVSRSTDPDLQRDWRLLQTSDHFYYMCTKWFSDGGIHKYFNPYPSPYEAFINYMNVLSDFILRVENGSAVQAIVQKSVRKTKSGDKVKESKKPVVKVKTRGEKPVERRPKQKKEAVKKDKKSPEFTIDNIVLLSDRKIKTLVKNIDIETLTVALKGSGKEIKEKIEKNLGKTGMKKYSELLPSLKKVKTSEVEKQRKKVEKEIISLMK
jgi:alpha-amylase